QGWTPGFRDTFIEWLGVADHVLLNEEEVAGFGGVSAILPALRPTATLIVKRGPEGAQAFRAGETFCVGAPRIDVIDTVGAGDSFNAAYLARRVAGAPLQEAIGYGVEVASRAVSTFPRRYSAD